VFACSVTYRDERSVSCSLRIGFGYFLTSFAILTGTPINGALLGSHGQWYKPTVFSGIVMLVGTVTLFVARALFVKKKGSQHL